MKASALALVAAVGTLPSIALALDTPQPAGRDKRIRVVTYDRDNVVQLYAAPGATVRIEIAADETIEAILVSDQTIMRQDLEVEDPGEASTPPNQRSAPAAACDRNLCRSIQGPFVYIKPVRDLDPQPLFIQTRKCSEDGKCVSRPYTLELVTRQGPLVEAAANTYYAIRFDYPADRVAAAAARNNTAAASRRASAAARAAQAAEAEAVARLRGQQIGGNVNSNYVVTGDRDVLGAPR